MIIALIVLIIFFIGILLINSASKSDSVINFVLIPITILSILFLGKKIDEDKPKVSLPEEYIEISRRKSNPDTLLGYWDKDSLVIIFKNNYDE